MKSYHNNAKITSLSDKSQIKINEITMYGQERRRDELEASIRANGGASVDDRVKLKQTESFSRKSVREPGFRRVRAVIN